MVSDKSTGIFYVFIQRSDDFIPLTYFKICFHLSMKCFTVVFCFCFVIMFVLFLVFILFGVCHQF